MTRILACVIVCASVARSGHAQPEPFFADWGLHLLEWTDGLPCEEQSPYPGDPDSAFTYIPHPGGGHGWPALHVRTTCSYDRLTTAGAVRAVMIRQRNCPFPYDLDGTTPAPTTIDDVLTHVPDMEYAFMDLEGDTVVNVAPNMLEVVQRARAVNPAIRVGNYAYHPGTYDPTRPYENQADRTLINDTYFASGVDVAMPDCYPYSPYLRHTLSTHYSGTAPNVRSAPFWGPLERFSVAKRDLPPDHLIIPWVTPFIEEVGFEATPPTVRDVSALVQHLRLRGANALYSFSAGAVMHPAFDAESYRAWVKDAWLDLDASFELGRQPEVLNLDTNKTGGVEWSGIKSGMTVTILGSNLSGTGPATIDLPSLPGLPSSITVAGNEHLLRVFTLCPGDLDQSGGVGFADLLQLIGAWGPCTGACPADLTADGNVDFADVLALFGEWGACP